MRNWINATRLLTEAGLINTKNDIELTWPLNNGSNGRFLISNVKSEIQYVWEENEAIEEWLKTVFLNYMVQHAYDADLVHFTTVLSAADFIKDSVDSYAWSYKDRGALPDENLFGKPEDEINDSLFRYLLNQLPEWAKDGDILFPLGPEAFYHHLDETDDAPFKLSTVLEYLQYRTDQGDNISRISMPDAIRLSAVWENSVRKKVLDDGPDDIRTVLDFGDGYKIVRLLTPKALDRESRECDHCVGKGLYDKKNSQWRITHLLAQR